MIRTQHQHSRKRQSPTRSPGTSASLLRAPRSPASRQTHASPSDPRHGVSYPALDRLERSLLEAALRRNITPSFMPAIRHAAQEAAAIAWTQPFPVLVFPALFEEKLANARRRHHHQNLIRSRSEEWLDLAS